MKDKKKILYNSGMMKNWKNILNEENTDDYIKSEEIKNRLSAAFNGLMREIMYSCDDLAHNFRYGSFGHNNDENSEQERKKTKHELREFVMQKFNKLKDVIDDTLGKTETAPTKENDSEGKEKGSNEQSKENS